MGTYRILPSKRPSSCKRPPIFDDPMVRVYMRYTTSPCKRPSPFIGREFQAPMGAYSGDCGTCTWNNTVHVHVGIGEREAVVMQYTSDLLLPTES